ncbi:MULTISPECIES: lamin tail domain-containing protein [unclassified Microbacterium]|uniref:lamin tail domain-containing protein n=1 Tax=unclassified Microbacterium TaxID=2609290 RepID=UPI001E49DFD9|nr:lamin tail domain-containing protein [Microbacterium sp. MAH-37]
MHRPVAAVAAIIAVAVSGGAFAAIPAVAAGPGVVVNEIVYDDIVPGAVDAIELFNAGSGAVDLSGWGVFDDKREESGTIPAGTILGAGQFLVLEKDGSPLGFPFGLGKGDTVTLVNASGTEVDSYAYTGDAPLGDWSRCADGGEWAHGTELTLGGPNNCDAPTLPGRVLLNEVDSGPADWIELINPGTEAADLTGVEIRDNSDDHRWFFPAGASIAGGERLVVEASTPGLDANGAPQQFQAAIGIGASDAIRVFAADGTPLDQTSWSGHPAIDGDEAAASYARCPDATGAFALARVTPGAANDCVLPDIAVNEVESNGDATDWVEITNIGSTPVDLSGWTLMDSDPAGHASDVTPVAAETTLAPGEFFVFDGGTHFGFGLGGADVATIRNADGLTVAEYAWNEHAAATWARCPDGTGEFADAKSASKGAANCGDGGGEQPGGPEEPEAAAWPGSPDVTVVDETAMFLEDSSGLDTQATPDGTVLWAVDNGTGTFWKLNVAVDGTVAFADGWEDGKRARFQRDAGDPAAAGPDSEGITVDGEGRVYLASERDNSKKGVNQNVVLEVAPDAPGPDVVADREWDLTATLPQVAANTGIEAVEWVADDRLAGKLIDRNTAQPYDPARYPGHGDGLFFVAVEDNGFVYAYALGADGSIAQVASIDPGLGGVMALDYDTVIGELWAVCDDGCEGRSARIAFTGAEPEIAVFARTEGMPNLNNEGFATSPEPITAPGEASPSAGKASREASAAVTGSMRPVWWFADGVQPAALRTGTLAVVSGEVPGEPGPGEGGTGPGSGSGEGESHPSQPGGSGAVTGGSTEGSLAATGLDQRLFALIPIALLTVLAGTALLLAARRRRTA